MIEEAYTTNLLIQVKPDDYSTSEIDILTRDLLNELKGLDLESASLIKESSNETGTKSGEIITIGAIAIAVLPAFMPKLLDFLQAWLIRSKERKIKFKGEVAGQHIEFEGSADDFDSVFSKINKNKTG